MGFGNVLYGADPLAAVERDAPGGFACSCCRGLARRQAPAAFHSAANPLATAKYDAFCGFADGS